MFIHRAHLPSTCSLPICLLLFICLYTGVDVRDWCKRMVHTLGAILDPLGTGSSSHTAAGAAAAAAGGPAFAILPPAAAVSGPGAKAAHLPGGYNAVAGFSALGFGGGSSSDEGSEDEGEVRRMTREQRLARKLGLGGGSRKKGHGRRSAAAAGVWVCVFCRLRRVYPRLV